MKTTQNIRWRKGKNRTAIRKKSLRAKRRRAGEFFKEGTSLRDLGEKSGRAKEGEREPLEFLWKWETRGRLFFNAELVCWQESKSESEGTKSRKRNQDQTFVRALSEWRLINVFCCEKCHKANVCVWQCLPQTNGKVFLKNLANRSWAPDEKN